MYKLNNNPTSPPSQKASEQTQQKIQQENTTISTRKEHPLRPKKILLSWQAIKFESSPKSSVWYVSVFLILVSLVATGLFTDNFPLAILAILIGLILYLFEKKEAQSFKFGITTEGVIAQNNIYKFSSLEDFWIFYEPNGRQELSLKSQKDYIPYIQIPLGDTDPTLIRSTLLNFIPEIEHEEAIVDSLEHLI